MKEIFEAHSRRVCLCMYCVLVYMRVIFIRANMCVVMCMCVCVCAAKNFLYHNTICAALLPHRTARVLKTHFGHSHTHACLINAFLYTTIRLIHSIWWGGGGADVA